MLNKQYILGIDPGGAEAPTRIVDKYTGNYYIYSDGRVQNIIKGNFLVDNSKGYKKVRLCNSGTVVKKKIHRLVAEHFIPNPSNYPCVNHIDGNKSNNNVNNLEWCTHQYNSEHAVKIGLHINKSAKVEKKCSGCSNTIKVDPNELRIYTYNFCSKNCYHTNQGWVQVECNKRRPKV